MIIIKGLTTKGDSFQVSSSKGELLYTDCFGQSLTWDDNPMNRDLVSNMIDQITSEECYSAVQKRR